MTTFTHNTVIGFDFGMKRIGVAVGQTITKTAQPLGTIKTTQGAPQWDQLTKYFKKWQPDALVVGIPLNMDGSEQPLTAAAKKFADLLRNHFKIPVYGMDERLTSVEAKARLFDQGGYKALKNAEVDSIAAQLILQNWLTQASNQT
jgi:putative Holliday junction resolvase